MSWNRPYYQDDSPVRRGGFSGKSTVKTLIIINVAVFIFMHLAGRHSSFRDILSLSPAKLFGRGYVWQLITYGFLHGGGWHLFWNMLMLFWFGREIERIYGAKRFLRFYLIATAVAGLTYCALRTLQGGSSNVPNVVGASGAVMALMVVYAFYFPNRIVLVMFIIPMKIWALVVVLVAMDAMGALPSDRGADNTAHLAHLGGAAYGLFYHKVWSRMSRYWPDVSAWRTRRQDRSEADDNRRLDALLDKVHQQGLPSLSASEKRFLKRMSERK